PRPAAGGPPDHPGAHGRPARAGGPRAGARRPEAGMRKGMRTVLSERAAAPRAAHTDGAWPLAEPFLIGDLRLENRVVQAPLAGIANWAFRRQSRRHGAGLAVSGMVASLGVRHGNRRTVGMLATAPDEHPVGIQLFGTDPAAMAE